MKSLSRNYPNLTHSHYTIKFLYNSSSIISFLDEVIEENILELIFWT